MASRSAVRCSCADGRGLIVRIHGLYHSLNRSHTRARLLRVLCRTLSPREGLIRFGWSSGSKRRSVGCGCGCGCGCRGRGRGRRRSSWCLGGGRCRCIGRGRDEARHTLLGARADDVTEVLGAYKTYHETSEYIRIPVRVPGVCVPCASPGERITPLALVTKGMPSLRARAKSM